MRKLINYAAAEVEDQHKAGLLPWTDKTVRSLITPYPHMGQLDEIEIGQEDEATSDPDGVPWEDDGDGDDQIPKASMNAEQADSVLEHSARLRSLQDAQDICKDMGGVLGASLMEVLSRVHAWARRVGSRRGNISL